MFFIITSMSIKEQRIKAAAAAIDTAGGPKVLAAELRAKGFDVNRDRVAKWRQIGVANKFVLAVSSITGVSSYDLHPELYPDEAA